MHHIKRGFGFFLKKIFTKPTESMNASEFIVVSVWLLRIFTFLFGIFQIFFGETIIGIAIVVSALFLIAPAIFTNNLITDIPLEIEFFLFLMVVVQFVLGEANGFYVSIPYYDKFVHFFLPFLLGFIGFVIAYSLYFSGKLKVSIPAMIYFVIVITLGIGAFWEILEYLNDQYVRKIFPDWHRFQGSSGEDPLTDTMHDLTADLIGGLVGSLVALRYVIPRKYNKRLRELLREIKNQLFQTTPTQ